MSWIPGLRAPDEGAGARSRSQAGARGRRTPVRGEPAAGRATGSAGGTGAAFVETS